MKRQEAPKQMLIRRSLAVLALSLCAFSATGCENGSFEFKGPSISFSQNYIDEGIQKFNAGDYEGALLVFNEMIEKFPEDPQGYINKGGSLINLNRLPEALEATNKAIELGTKDPNPIAYRNHATILFTLNESPESLKEALKSINRSIELNPAVADAYNLRGAVRANMGDNPGALPDFSKAIELNKNYVNAWSNRGAAKTYLGNHSGAITDANKAIELDPDYAASYRVRAIAYSQQDNMTDSCSDMKKASSLGDSIAIRILKDNPGACK